MVSVKTTLECWFTYWLLSWEAAIACYLALGERTDLRTEQNSLPYYHISLSVFSSYHKVVCHRQQSYTAKSALFTSLKFTALQNSHQIGCAFLSIVQKCTQFLYLTCMQSIDFWKKGKKTPCYWFSWPKYGTCILCNLLYLITPRLWKPDPFPYSTLFVIRLNLSIFIVTNLCCTFPHLL